MNLETLSEWISFFASEDKIHDAGLWSVLGHCYDDQDCTLLFEKYNHRTPTRDNPVHIKQFIITPAAATDNKLLANILFLAEHNFSLDKIIAQLESITLREEGAALVGNLGETQITVMTFNAYESLKYQSA